MKSIGKYLSSKHNYLLIDIAVVPIFNILAGCLIFFYL